MSERSPASFYFQLHLLVATLATTAILGRLISLPAAGLVWWRTLLAAPAALAMASLIFRRSVIPPWPKLLKCVGIGMIVGVHWLCFFGSIRLSNISICLAGFATISFLTALTEPLFERRRVRGAELLLGCLVLAGICLVARVESAHWAGLAVALLGSVLAAVFPVLNRHMVRREEMDPVVMVGWEMAGAWLACTALLPALEGPGCYGRLLDLRGLDWLWLGLLAWVCTTIAHAFHIHLLRRMSAYTANLAMNFEPVYGIIAAALVFGEHKALHPGYYAGAATILLANLIHPVVLARTGRREKLKAES